MDFENRPARLILINDITEKKKNKELLIQSAIDGEDKERKRIAQELHDGIGQYLSAVNLNMESIKKEIEKLTDRKQDRFLNTLSIIKKAMKETRALAYTLMPVELEEYGLILAIKSLAREMEGTSDVKIKTSISKMDSILNKNIKSNFYRIIQEAFNNAIKHGKATFIELSLKHENEFIYCRIKDNGKGMNTDKLKEATGLGIKSIKARTETMSGVLNIESNPGKGLEITIKVPVKQTSRT
jgi:signal transduction histidine kinase